MEKKSLQLSPPWLTFFHEIQGMFKHDPTVKVIFNSETDSVDVYVEDADKADAITQILVPKKEFGNVKVAVNVIPGNGHSENSGLPLFQRAFKDNSALAFTTEDQKGLFTMAYVVFVPEIVQFFNDDLTDIHGLASMLFADIAKDIFRHDLKVSFCTDKISEGVGMPLGEWP